MDNRRYPRFPLCIPVRCESTVPCRYRGLGFTRNASRTGLLLEAAAPLLPGAWTGLRLLTVDRVARAEAVVVWAAEGSPSRMGLQFTAMTEANFLAWEQCLAAHAGLTPRCSLRVPSDLEVSCAVSAGTTLQGRARNLSEGGMQVVLPHAVPPREHVRVTVPARLVLPPIEAEVVWTRTAPANHDVVHGLRFLAGDMGLKLFRLGSFLQRYLD